MKPSEKIMKRASKLEDAQAKGMTLNRHQKRLLAAANKKAAK